MKITGDIQQQMLWMMIFGVCTYMTDSFIGIALSINKDDISYCKSLRLTRWQMLRETLILGKSADIFLAATQQFAIAWMLISSIENIFKTNGGIGVVLADSNKYFKFDQVYAVQIIILLTGITIDFTLRLIRSWIYPYTQLKQI